MNRKHEHRDEAIERGFDAGNYANAYVSEDFDTAWDANSKLDPRYPLESYRDAFLIGFFSSYEDHELPTEYQEHVTSVRLAMRPTFERLGIAID
jgi:hypothetical protein